MVRRQEIEESNLEATKTNALEQATLQFRQEIFDIDKRLLTSRNERKKREADERKRREADPGFKMKKQLRSCSSLKSSCCWRDRNRQRIRQLLQGCHHWQQECPGALADMMASVAEHL